jgi:two-component system, OmpR family, phosphate regulon sensor histidine kinase PhoR
LKSKILWKLFGTFTLVISLSLLILYFYLTPALSGFLLRYLEKELSEKVSLIRDHLEVLPSSAWEESSLDPLADEWAKDINTRVTIIDGKGKVLGDSELSGPALEHLENHLQRPEIQQSLHAPFGSSTRYSTTLKTNMMYVALKTSRGFVRAALPLHVIDQTEKEIKKSVFFAALWALALTMVVGFLFSRSLSRPLNEMSEVTEAISRGDFSKRLVPYTRDEFGVLAEAINKMAKGLEKQFKEIETEKNQLRTILDGMVEGVLVTDEGGGILLVNPALRSILHLEGECTGKTILECFRNKTIYESIQKALQSGASEEVDLSIWIGSEERDLILHTTSLLSGANIIGSVSVFYDVTRIRRLENIRKEFVANVSHELKTPLTNILGYAETLRSGALADGEASTRFVEKIESNAVQLKNLVEDILKLSEIESGRMELNPVSIGLLDFVRSLESDYEEDLKAKRLSFDKSISSDLKVFADPVALRQILGNLVDNAIKYSSIGGTIHVESELIEQFCQVAVADTGMGIHEKDLPHLFERFYRVDKSRSRQLGGTGLGLSIVKHLVQLHGGKVWAESQIGQGSRFYFTLPQKIS